MKRSILVVAVLLLALIMTVSVCGAAKKYVIGFSQLGAESGWRDAETESVKSAAVTMGIDLKFSDGQQKQENQIKAIRAFIAQRVDGILLAPVVESGWDAVLKEAKDAKIPVVLLDRGIDTKDESLYVCRITSDFIWEGNAAAQWLAKKMNGKANIAELEGTPGASAAIERKKGFEDAIKKFPGMKIVKDQTGDFTRAGGKEVMEAFLKADPSINAVFAHNDDMAIGAIQAIEEAGKKPGVDIVTVSIDGIKPLFEAMVAGKANCTVECNPLLGPIGFQTVIGAINGKKYPKWVVQKDGVFPQETAAKALPTRKY
jgi:ABC-type sugar transport system, periplasmic component